MFLRLAIRQQQQQILGKRRLVVSTKHHVQIITLSPSIIIRHNSSSNNNNNNKSSSTDNEEEVTKLKEELKTMREDLLYALAEVENVRRIAKNDVADSKAFGSEKMAKSLLDVVDVLRKANESVFGYTTDDNLIKQFLIGVDSTEKNLIKALKTNGVESFGVQGEKFDPKFHEAIAQVPDPIHPPNSISQVLRQGWKLHSRVLRPAQVVLAKEAPKISPQNLETPLNVESDETDEKELEKKINTKF